MRRQRYICLFVLALLFAGLLSTNVYAANTEADEKQVESQANTQQRDWEFVLELYGWAADLEFTLPTGDEAEITFSDIMDNLDMTFMSAFGVRKDKWTFMTDAIYLDLDQSDNTNLNQLFTLTDIYLKAWIVSPFVSYEIMGGEKGSLQLKAGPRYFWLETGLELKTRPPLDPGKTDDSISDDVWDAVVGIRGHFNLADRWSIPYVLDIGTGDSDYTWQAMGGISYQFDKFQLLAVYRYMHREFDERFSILEDLTVKGPAVGAIFTF